MTYKCPKCGMVSHNPNDERYGWCGNCEAFTSERERLSRWLQDREVEPATSIRELYIRADPVGRVNLLKRLAYMLRKEGG